MGGTTNYFFLRCQTLHDLLFEDLSNDFHWVTNPVQEPWLCSNDVSKFDLTSSRCCSLWHWILLLCLFVWYTPNDNGHEKMDSCSLYYSTVLLGGGIMDCTPCVCLSVCLSVCLFIYLFIMPLNLKTKLKIDVKFDDIMCNCWTSFGVKRSKG